MTDEQSTTRALASIAKVLKARFSNLSVDDTIDLAGDILHALGEEYKKQMKEIGN
jgi:hypothetical protein